MNLRWMAGWCSYLSGKALACCVEWLLHIYLLIEPNMAIGDFFFLGECVFYPFPSYFLHAYLNLQVQPLVSFQGPASANNDDRLIEWFLISWVKSNTQIGYQRQFIMMDWMVWWQLPSCNARNSCTMKHQDVICLLGSEDLVDLAENGYA